MLTKEIEKTQIVSEGENWIEIKREGKINTTVKYNDVEYWLNSVKDEALVYKK